MSEQEVKLLKKSGKWFENPLVAFGVIAVVTSGIYLNSLNNGFHYDDKPTIEDNEAIRSLKNIPSFFTSVQPFS